MGRGEKENRGVDSFFGRGGGGKVRKMPNIFGALLAQNRNIKLCA